MKPGNIPAKLARPFNDLMKQMRTVEGQHDALRQFFIHLATGIRRLDAEAVDELEQRLHEVQNAAGTGRSLCFEMARHFKKKKGKKA